MKSLIIPAQTEYLDELNDFTDSVLDETDCSMKIRLQIRLAVEEIFVNIASYAYPDGGGQAWIDCEIRKEPERFWIRLTDTGTAFNPLAREDADTSADALMAREGGLGILLVKKTMDQVEYERQDGKNILTITKNL